jgi:23S rRNA pseudouridine955/2504/2580 synthase
MEKFLIDQDLDGKSLVRSILVHYPFLSAGRVFQALRQKDIRLNGRRQHVDCPVQAGDEVILYLGSGVGRPAGSSGPGTRTGAADGRLAEASSYYTLVYQDPLILIVNKKPGIAVQPGQAGRVPEPDLLSEIRRDFQDIAIELGHRLDQQTGGLIILARTPEGLAAVRGLLLSGGIVKRYRCLVRGRPDTGTPIICHDGAKMLEISAWLEKDAGHSQVHIHEQKQPGDLEVTTRYRILRVFPEAGPEREHVCLVEVELVTGRTHQIRAHFAHIGHQIIGDGKYGRNSFNRFFRGCAGPVTRQQLFATQLDFLPENQGPLAYLAGRTFGIEPEFDWQAP